jgi:hypothetical protein
MHLLAWIVCFLSIGHHCPPPPSLPPSLSPSLSLTLDSTSVRKCDCTTGIIGRSNDDLKALTIVVTSSDITVAVITPNSIVNIPEGQKTSGMFAVCGVATVTTETKVSILAVADSYSSAEAELTVLPACKPFFKFTSGQLDVTSSADRLPSVVEENLGNLDGIFRSYPDLLSKQNSIVLQQYAETICARSNKDSNDGFNRRTGNITQDFSFNVSVATLNSLIGLENTNKMYTAFNDFDSSFSVNDIIFRRTRARGDSHIRYHNDGHMSVLHVSLNGDELEGGGSFHYITSNGIVNPDFRTGYGIAHGHQIIHGISSFTGTRYILALQGRPNVRKDFFNNTDTPVVAVVHSEL